MRQWAITVGINHYQYLQPLSYARQDAEAMGQGLITQAKVPADQVLLFTETASPIEQQSSWPSRLTLQNWLDRLTRHSVQSGDRLWFFFSGYGVCSQGQDYLMPIDGQPKDCRGTALPVELVFQYLKHAPAEQVLVLLDISRQAGLEQPNVGAHTAYLAEQMGIPTILSCQPGQLSQSTVALQQGLFTRSLLEALQTQQEITPAYLERVLRDRLPDLCTLYGCLLQQVLTICPANLLEQPMLLQPASIQSPPTKPIDWQGVSSSPDMFGEILTPAAIEHSQPLQESAPEPTPSLPALTVTEQAQPLISLSHEGWHWFKLGVGLLAALVFSGLLLSHLRTTISFGKQAALRRSLSSNPALEKPPANSSGPGTTLLPTQPTTYTSLLGPAQARTLIKSDQASPFWDAIQEVRKLTPGHPEYALMPQAIAGWSQDIWTIAQQRATRGEFDTAILAAALVPPDQAVYQPARAAIRQWCPLFRYRPERNIDQQREAAAICRTTNSP